MNELSTVNSLIVVAVFSWLGLVYTVVSLSGYSAKLTVTDTSSIKEKNQLETKVAAYTSPFAGRIYETVYRMDLE